jgi:hypothetical protein
MGGLRLYARVVTWMGCYMDAVVATRMGGYMDARVATWMVATWMQGYIVILKK